MTSVVKSLVRDWLREDIGPGDVTTNSLIPRDVRKTAVLVARRPGIVCGMFLAQEIFRRLDRTASFRSVPEGSRVRANGEVLRVNARARAILTGERTALNVVQRLSGIATLTDRFVRQVKGTGARILDTRKTTPGLRSLERYAVRMGGGSNHRMGLWDAVLVKDNHLELARSWPRLARALGRLGRKGLRIQIEAQSIRQLRQVLEMPAHAVLLDNFSVGELRKAVSLVRRVRPSWWIEASGGVTLETVREIAETGVDAISVGSLTHSAPALDISLEFLR